MTHYLVELKRPYTLCDHVLPYCAECLEYIDPYTSTLGDSLQVHHIFRRAVTKHEFGRHYTKGWVVPVHQKCHQSGIGGIDLLSGTLADHFFSFKNMSVRDQAVIARELHNAGNYGMSLLVKALMINTAAKNSDYDSCWLNMEFCQASASALVWRRSILSHIEKAIPRSNILTSRPQYLLNKAKIYALDGDFSNARECISQATSVGRRLNGRHKKNFELVNRRAFTSVRCNTPGVSSHELKEALSDVNYAENEAESVYTASTSRVLRGNLLYKMAKYKDSRDIFEQVLHSDTQLSWGYCAMAWFHRALCRLQSNEPLNEVYKDLVRAQYVQSMLGLAGHAHRATDGLLCDLPHDCMPGHILTRWSEFPSGHIPNGKYRAYLTTLRKEAIGIRGNPRSVWAGVRASLELIPDCQ